VVLVEAALLLFGILGPQGEPEEQSHLLVDIPIILLQILAHLDHKEQLCHILQK
jgi:hypothetical protein